MAIVTRGWSPWARDIVLTLGEGEGRPLSSGLGGTVSASPSAKESTDSDNRRRLATTLANPISPSSRFKHKHKSLPNGLFRLFGKTPPLR